MNFQRTSIQPLYLSGCLAISLGLITSAYSIHQFKLDPDPEGWTALCIPLNAILGAILCQIGIGFCIAWIMIPAKEPGYCRVIARANEKSSNQHDDAKGRLQYPNAEESNPSAVPLNLNDRHAKYYLAFLSCTALTTSLQFASAVTRLYTIDGVLAIGTWTCGTAIAATVVHFGAYLFYLYKWCKALKLDDARILETYKYIEGGSAA